MTNNEWEALPNEWIWIDKDGWYCSSVNPPKAPDEVTIIHQPNHSRQLEEAYDRAMSIL